MCFHTKELSSGPFCVGSPNCGRRLNSSGGEASCATSVTRPARKALGVAGVGSSGCSREPLWGFPPEPPAQPPASCSCPPELWWPLKGFGPRVPEAEAGGQGQGLRVEAESGPPESSSSLCVGVGNGLGDLSRSPGCACHLSRPLGSHCLQAALQDITLACSPRFLCECRRYGSRSTSVRGQLCLLRQAPCSR